MAKDWETLPVIGIDATKHGSLGGVNVGNSHAGCIVRHLVLARVIKAAFRNVRVVDDRGTRGVLCSKSTWSCLSLHDRLGSEAPSPRRGQRLQIDPFQSKNASIERGTRLLKYGALLKYCVQRSCDHAALDGSAVCS